MVDTLLVKALETYLRALEKIRENIREKGEDKSKALRLQRLESR